MSDVDREAEISVNGISRSKLVERLAEISHETWMRQAERDKGQQDLDPAVTDHDRERAEDTVRELERLGIFREGE